jgi:hypothetical protein
MSALRQRFSILAVNAVNHLNSTDMTRCLFFILLILAGCKEKVQQENVDNQGIEVDSAKDFFEQPEDGKTYDYARFLGIYDHESRTGGFSAVLAITENGNDLSFTLSVAQGNGCKGEAEGAIFMMSHETNYYVGFYQLENCQLQFSFMLQEDKIDVKEINICRLHEGSCTFEGTYAKRTD